MPKYDSANKAVEIVQSNNRVFIHTAAAAPQRLLNALTERHASLKNVEFISAHTEGEAPYIDEKYADSFKVKCFFSGHNIRKAVQSGRAEYIPIFLSEIPDLFASGRMPLDVALLHLSPPDENGYCSLGCSVDISYAASQSARKIIAQINPNMPVTEGDAKIHLSKIDAWIECNDPLFELDINPASEVEKSIGKFIAELVEDGSTLQMGIGGIPNAALGYLEHHKDLGLHTEMCSDGIIPLIKKGVITNKFKQTDPGKSVAGFAFGTRKIYEFIHKNPEFLLKDVGYVNDTRVIRQNPKVIAINSAIEVDAWGQVCADSIGNKHYSGVGGQMDFIRGATLSKGGKAIIALPSRTASGIPRIVANLNVGASVVTTRAHIQFIVTEYGIADLYAKSLPERALQMVNVAHPDDRDEMSKEIYLKTGIKI